MDIKKFLSESRAVSPVIGVILMVAITVILAAVIGTFVLGLGDQVGDNAPQASFSFDYTANAADPANGSVTITHESGDALDATMITIEGPVNEDGQTWNVIDGSATQVNAGSELVVTGLGDGETVRVVWTSDNGDSATLQKYTYNA
ncbi:MULTISPECIES: type IV pilin [Haloferax]|uniref:Type IV pilin n=1 Tax=Haloferax marinum TaxID=2666143 RepID=A0A6A8GAJ4_9EURY|nr:MULTISPECIES: type IV pilin N-terminal domain-containing protein [Haloferax]KAB1191204.1 type IV pilin [Haloferax sp. CBA1150]MRW98094.1 type IV pilin [Haloferax marinum]